MDLKALDWKLILRKHLFSIICGVVALLAIVALFYPLSGMFTSLEEDLKTRTDTYSKINNLLRAERFEPSIRPDIKKPLDGFPVPAVIKQGNDITSTWNQIAVNFQTAAVKLQVERMLAPLVPEALPSPSASAQNTFRTLYRNRLNVVQGVATGTNTGAASAVNLDTLPQNSIYREVLNGTFPPNAEEIRKEQEERAKTIMAEFAQGVGGEIRNREEVDKRVKDVTTKIADKMRMDRARKGLIYADPNVFQPFPAPALANPNERGQPTANEIFNAQVWLWMQQDIAQAIREVNLKDNPEKAVTRARIKRLLSCQIKSMYFVPGAATPGAVPGAPVDPAAAATPPAAAPATDLVTDLTNAARGTITLDYKTNPLGHTGNPLYDVFNFELVMLVEVDALGDVLTEMCSNRYMLIQNLPKITSIDPTKAMVEGYIYGTKPLAQVTVQGQYLIFRPVLVHGFMPADIRTNPTVVQVGTTSLPGSMPGGMPGGGFGPGGYPMGDGMMPPPIPGGIP